MSRPFGSKNKDNGNGGNVDVNSTGQNIAPANIVYNPSAEAEIKNIKSRLDDIEMFRNAESVENKIRSLSEEMDNLTSLINGIKKDVLEKVEKYCQGEIKGKVSDEIKKMIDKMTK
jgi:hypothetical protein